MNRKRYVFRTPLLILLVLVIALILLVKVGLPMLLRCQTAQQKKRRSTTADACGPGRASRAGMKPIWRMGTSKSGSRSCRSPSIRTAAINLWGDKRL